MPDDDAARAQLVVLDELAGKVDRGLSALGVSAWLDDRRAVLRAQLDEAAGCDGAG